MKKFTIETGVPIPKGYQYGDQHLLRETMRAMNIGESFIFQNQSAAINASKSVGIKITTRKISGEGFRIWRLK